MMVGKFVPFPPENILFSSESIPHSPEIVLPSHQIGDLGITLILNFSCRKQYIMKMSTIDP